MAYRPRVVQVVSHTHWDREWYLPFHTFRVNLIKVVRKVIEALEGDPEFHHFLLDGQSIILEDYLQIHPEDEPRLRSLVDKGQLSIGPWYILPDAYLISAEATIRNLLIGNRVAARIGEVQKVGYMPDSFGHIAQMPQILRQAGIGSFIYTRGNGDEIDKLGHEFIWQAPDGSEVLAINQCGGYCNGAGLGFDEIWHAHTRRTVNLERAVEQVREWFEKCGERTRGDIVLLNNGCDHFPPQQEFGRVMEALRNAFPETEFRHSNLREFIEVVEESGVATERFCGELLGGKLHLILSGVWSARMYLKQQNDEAQTMLASEWEPLAAYEHFMLERAYPSGLIEYTWKLLLQNHPHDSICGCSIDEVHREMETRFEGALQTIRQSIVDILEPLAPTFARQAEQDRDTTLCVANTLPFRRTEVVERIVVLQPLGYDLDAITLVDEEGTPIPLEIVNRKYIERFWGVDYRTMLSGEAQQEALEKYLDSFGSRILKTGEDRDEHDCFLHIRFLAEDLPGVGHNQYRLIERDHGSQPEYSGGEVRVKGMVIENRYCQVTVHTNGTFDLFDKISKREYRGMNLVESAADIGDEYDFAPCPGSETITTESVVGETRTVDAGGLTGSIEVSFSLSLPREIDADRSARSRVWDECPITIRISLNHNSPVIEVELKFDNRVKDHRLRARFPVLIETDRVISDGHFFTNERPLERPSGDDWAQPAPRTWPQQDFSLLQDCQGGVALFNRGLPEIQPICNGDEGTGLALTLMRCVGWLSRDDLDTRHRQNAGPTIPTPDAQCFGRQRFRYALVPFTGNWVDAGIKNLSQRWRTPPIHLQGVGDQAVPGGCGLVELNSKKICITAVKKHEERETLIVRLYNLTGERVEEALCFGRAIRAAWQVNLEEERQESVSLMSASGIRFEVSPFRIVTLEIEFDDRESR